MSRKVSLSKPGPINNSGLVSVPTTKVTSLTGEGGQLKRNMLLRGRDFQLVPNSLWKALVQWYRGSPALPRQVNNNIILINLILNQQKSSFLKL